jgi:uncharacterized membrane protein YfcA
MPLPLPLPALFLAPLVVVVAYVVLAIGGFGSALISIPLLALILPVKLVMPLVLIVDFIATATSGMRFRHDVALGELKPLLPWTALGLIAGVTLLVKLPQQWVLLTLGLFIFGYAIYSLAYHDRANQCSRWWSIPTGLSGGVISGLFGMGGPMYVVYLARRIGEPVRLRATLATIFSLNAAARLALFLFSGLLLQIEVWIAALYLLPFMVLGLVIGHRIHLKLDRLQIARLVSLLLLGTGVSILWKALAAG